MVSEVEPLAGRYAQNYRAVKALLRENRALVVGRVAKLPDNELQKKVDVKWRPPFYLASVGPKSPANGGGFGRHRCVG